MERTSRAAPVAVREELALAEGAQLAIIVRDGVIELRDFLFADACVKIVE